MINIYIYRQYLFVVLITFLRFVKLIYIDFLSKKALIRIHTHDKSLSLDILDAHNLFCDSKFRPPDYLNKDRGAVTELWEVRATSGDAERNWPRPWPHGHRGHFPRFSCQCISGPLSWTQRATSFGREPNRHRRYITRNNHNPRPALSTSSNNTTSGWIRAKANACRAGICRSDSSSSNMKPPTVAFVMVDSEDISAGSRC